MRLRLGRPRRALIVAPHADDEAIGAWGLMTALRRRGTRIAVLVVTDGAASHPDSPSWPRARLVAERRRESRRAMRRLGLGHAHVRFLDLPDGRLPDHSGCRRIVRQGVARHGRLDLLVGPATDDDHGDHRAVADALARLPLGRARRLTYKVWPVGRPPRGSRTLPLTPATVAAKRSAVRGYATQAGRITDDPRGFAMTPRQIAAFCTAREHFRETRR